MTVLVVGACPVRGRTAIAARSVVGVVLMMVMVVIMVLVVLLPVPAQLGRCCIGAVQS